MAIVEFWSVPQGAAPQIEHIQSTAVPSVATKPTMGLMAAANRLDLEKSMETS